MVERRSLSGFRLAIFGLGAGIRPSSVAPPSRMTRIATVDIGTNTILLLVAEVGERRMEPVYEEDRYVRLGEGVDAQRRLLPAAMDRVVTALHAYRRKAEELGAGTVVIGATSASRDARNRHELADRVRDELGLEYGVLSGEEEARWAFRGACSAYPDLDAACVLDIGGGSTEVTSGRTGGDPSARVSVDVGSVRLTERCFPQLPPPPSAIDAADTFVEEAFRRIEINRRLPLLGASGTVSALARLVHPESPWRPVGAATVRAWRDRLLARSADEVRRLDPALMAGRADVFAAGVLILDAFLRRFGYEALRPSPRGLRHGLALRWMEANGLALPGARAA